jgi:lactate dehydrogenase-like 2-hydroxyacid dehydrogenase
MDLLKAACDTLDVFTLDRPPSKREIIDAVKGKKRDGLLCLLCDPIDRDVIDALGPTVKGIADCAVGYNNIDVNRATELGIPVSNTPGVLTHATADLAWALLFAAARRIVESDKFTRAGKFAGWGPMLHRGADVTGATLGVVGAGRIGAAFALKSKGFNMRVLYCDHSRNETLEKELGAKRVDLETLLRESDFVSLHVPLVPETHHLIDAKRLALMKPTAFLINTSRGPVVDEAALVAALKEKRIAGAGLDVYENEPAFAQGLVDLDNVVMVAHIGSATTATRAKMAQMAAADLIAMMKGDRPQNCVNPEVYERKRIKDEG